MSWTSLELVYTDVCDPINVQPRRGYEYFITFTNDFSRYGYVYLMHRKSESFEIFKAFNRLKDNWESYWKHYDKIVVAYIF